MGIFKPREAQKGFGDNVPKQVWAAAQRNPMREAPISLGIEEEPTGDNFDSDKLRKSFAMIAEILSILYQNEKRRLPAPV